VLRAVGTGTITPLRFFGALAVLAGVILGLGRAPQVPSGTLNQADRGAKPSAGRWPPKARREAARTPTAIRRAGS